jgi:hypothetical protein
MSTVDKNPVVKTRSGKGRGRFAGGAVDESEMTARINETLNRWPTVGLAVPTGCTTSLILELERYCVNIALIEA